MYNSSLSRECIIHPGQEEKDGTFPDENPLPTTPNVYIFLTLNSRYDEIGIDLWTSFSESRLRVEDSIPSSSTFFFFFSFSFGESFRIKRNYPFWSGGRHVWAFLE